MMLGYAADSAQNVYRFLHMETMKIVHSRDVIWLGYKFHESSKNSIHTTPAPDDHEDEEKMATLGDDHEDEEKMATPEDDEEEIESSTNVTNKESEENIIERRQTCSQGYSTPPIPTAPRAIRAVAKLAEYNESPENQVGREERATLSLDHLFDECMLFSKENEANDVEPKEFKEAWHHPMPEVRKKMV